MLSSPPSLFAPPSLSASLSVCVCVSLCLSLSSLSNAVCARVHSGGHAVGGGGGNKVRIEVCTNACRSKAVGRTVGQKQYCVLSLKYTPSQVTMYVLQTIPNDVFERLQRPGAQPKVGPIRTNPQRLTLTSVVTTRKKWRQERCEPRKITTSVQLE